MKDNAIEEQVSPAVPVLSTDAPLSAQASRFALYIHIPFCVTKCPYCDFNSYARPAQQTDAEFVNQEQQYLAALLQEMHTYHASADWQEKRLVSIFFGGGTPSLLSGDSVARLLLEARDLWPTEPDLEITLEANPGTLREALGREKLQAFYEAGVNRLSFGVQSLRAEKLRLLGRLHLIEDTAHSLSAARAAGFRRINVDAMYGLPKETVAEWQAELQEFLALGVEHLSAYTLTIEAGTEFAKQARKGVIVQADEDALAEMYSETQNALQAAEYEQYETSNFARSNERCRHNMMYWRWESYLGLGAGAHSFLRRQQHGPGISRRWMNIPKPEHYLDRIQKHQLAPQRTESLSREQEMLECLYCFIRTSDGLPRREFDSFFSTSSDELFAAVEGNLLSERLISYDPERLRLSQRGFLFSDHVLAELAAAVSAEIGGSIP